MTDVMGKFSHDEFLLLRKKTRFFIQYYVYSNITCAYITPLQHTGPAQVSKLDARKNFLVRLLSDRAHGLHFDRIFYPKQSYRFRF